MSIRVAQKIINEVHKELGINLVVYQNVDLEFLRDKLEEFLELDIATEDLEDPDDYGDDTPSSDKLNEEEYDSEDAEYAEEDGEYDDVLDEFEQCLYLYNYCALWVGPLLGLILCRDIII